MLLKKIHHLKTKIKSHISNIDLLEVIIEDNNDIREELNALKQRLEEKDEQIQVLHKRSAALEKLNIAYSKDISRWFARVWFRFKRKEKKEENCSLKIINT